MAQEIEIEFKNLLTLSEYNRLLTTLNFPISSFFQENYYFDTKDFQLKNKGSALRIRKKNNKYVLTLKEPHEEGLLETHDELTEEEATAMINGHIIPKEHTQKQLKKLGVSEEMLICYGSLLTERRTIHFEDTLLVLDYSQYNDQADYELELEADSYIHGETVFKKLLEKYKIPWRETPNKIERFFSSKPE